jgi:predicted permease
LQAVILPVFIVIAVGFILQKLMAIEAVSISNIVLHVFTPCLIFTSIIGSSLGSNDWWKISLLAVASTIALVALSWTIARGLHLSRELATAFVLSTSFVNAGNYGLPLSLFAFGEKGLEIAVIFFVATFVLVFTLGVFIACSRGGVREAVKSIVRLPLTYALLAAIAVRFSGVVVPQPVLQGVNLMSQAAIPAMLIVLGMELARSNSQQLVNWKLVGLSSAIKLLLPMLLVAVISDAIGLGGIARDVTLVQASTPTAVFAVILTVKFGGDSRFVTSAIVLSTLASILTLTLLLSFIL